MLCPAMERKGNAEKGKERNHLLAEKKVISPWYKKGKLHQIFRAILEANDNVYVGQHYKLFYHCHSCETDTYF